MVTIIILIVVLLFAIIIVPFTRDLVKDKEELGRTPINEKFKVLVSIINDGLLDGKGEITLVDNDPRLMSLMSKEKRNMLIQFYYSTGNLKIILRYKWLQKELIWERQFNGLRNITIFMQKDIANQFIEMSREKIVEHQRNVGFADMNMMSGTQNSTESAGDPTSVVSSAFKDLTLSQKKSIVNLLYVIASSGGNEENKILRSVSFNHQILFLNVLWIDCREQLSQYGREKIYSDLKGIDRSVITMIIAQCFCLIMELRESSDIAAMESTFFESFNNLGYSDDEIKGEIEKVVALQKMFGR